jgi:hypothetical protein
MATNGDESPESGACVEPVVEPLVAVYRHDVHKLRGRRHAAAREECYGVRVNEDVPLGADRDAALLSRPAGEPERTVANHASPYRLSLVTGEVATDSRRIVAAGNGGFADLVRPADPVELHATWLTSDVAAAFNEAVHYPYTSLKYHVLLTGALLAAYRDGYAFDDLYLAARPGAEGADPRDAVASTAVDSDVVSPYETVLWSPAVTLAVTPEPGERPAAWLGSGPARSFADVWSRLPANLVETDGRRAGMVVDAQLRRIRSWSTALQFIEDFTVFARERGRPRRSSAGNSSEHTAGSDPESSSRNLGGEP